MSEGILFSRLLEGLILSVVGKFFENLYIISLSITSKHLAFLGFSKVVSGLFNWLQIFRQL